MALEIGAVLLEVAIGLAKSAWDAEDNIDVQAEKLAEIAHAVTEIQTKIDGIHTILTANDPPPEVARFRRARQRAASKFDPHWDISLLDFATELLTLVMTDIFSAVRITIDAYVHDPDTSIGMRYAKFDVIVPATVSVSDNATRLASFFTALHVFNASAPIPHRMKPTFTLSLARGNSLDFAQFDRLKNRITIRLLMLSTMALGWGQCFFGSVNGPHVYNAYRDDAISKHVVVHEVSHTFARNVALGIRGRTFARDVENVLKRSLESDVAGVRIIILSQTSWTHANHITTVHHFTDHIRSFFNSEKVKCLEMVMNCFDDWDRAMLRTVLLHALSTSILVFRFDSLDSLGDQIINSKEITDCFSGLTSHRERIMFVDTVSTSAFGSVRSTVQDIAVERRLLEPRSETDVLFEASAHSTVVVDISNRARQNRSILNNELRGRCRKHLERVVHILNREITVTEALAESEECLQFALRLKSWVNTKVTVGTNPDFIKIGRGDSTGYTGGNNRLMRESEYRDFRDVSESQPFTVDATIQLGSVPAGLHAVGKFNKWKVVSRMAALVREKGSLFMTVADEQKKILEYGNNRYIASLRVTVLGGGMKEFLYAKMIRCCLDAVQADLETRMDGETTGPFLRHSSESSDGQVAIRTLLRLVPDLAKATRRMPSI